MIEFKVIREKEKWNNVLEKYPKAGIYDGYDYLYSFLLHGDGIPLLFCYEEESRGICLPVHLSDIKDSGLFMNHITQGEYYDMSTPYGYGGPLCFGPCDDEFKSAFIENLRDYCNRNKIVTLFFRFNPMTDNALLFNENIETVRLKNTVFMDTSNEETIFKNMAPKTRNMVRKARKNGVNIISDCGEKIMEFKKIYDETMTRVGVDEYYFFEEKYYDYLKDNMSKNMIILYAVYEGLIVGASIFLYDKNGMHYHLSGTMTKYRNMGINDYILYSAALIAYKKGLKTLHLGGGSGAYDSLFSFKKHFNENGLRDFYIGRMIFDKEAFDKLVNIRIAYDKEFDKEKSFLIKYRG
ncbi:MAG: peptidoglycan bridge formation glycyltransferase FemA/FemB family protein [Lachnospiraceae bacterium]|nr:peptidoglycan bridge formation glycyltransferase FemA/FemB family protein [Lachnospiraceae bacterium]